MRALAIFSAMLIGACSPPAVAELPAEEGSEPLILECDVSLTAYEGNEITQRRTYKIDLVEQTLRFWDGDRRIWIDGGAESRLANESPTDISFESEMMLGRLQQTNWISFDRAIGAVEGSIRFRDGEREQTSHFAGPCKKVAAPGESNAF